MMHMFSIKIEYYRSFLYSVKWKNPMSPKRNYNRLKAQTAQTSPNSNEDSVRRRIGCKRQQKGRKEAQSGKGADVDKQSDDDVLDLIDRSPTYLPEEARQLVAVADEGVDHSDDDQVSVTSSVMSGPSRRYDASDDKPLTLCPVCRKLHQKAKRMKAPLKDKLLDTNPKSLTCDQWILLKPWRRSRKLDRRKSLMDLAQLFRKLRMGKKGKEKNQLTGEVVCSRPHLFLQRNLNQCIKKPVMKEKKRNRRKRAREDSWGPRVAKQKCTRSNHRPTRHSFTHDTEPVQHEVTHNNNSLDLMDSDCSSSSLHNGPHDSDPSSRLPPVYVPSEAIHHSFQDFPQHAVPKRGGFRDLLAQLRGNTSMIIRETRY